MFTKLNIGCGTFGSPYGSPESVYLRPCLCAKTLAVGHSCWVMKPPQLTPYHARGVSRLCEAKLSRTYDVVRPLHDKGAASDRSECR